MKILVHTVAILAIFLCTTMLHGQCMQYEVPFEDIIQGSTLIVEGEVKSHVYFQHSSRRNIYTLHEIELYKVIKGEPSMKTIQVLTRGGQFGNLQEVVTPEVQLQAGDRGVFLLQPIKEVPDLANLTSEVQSDNVYALWTMEQSYFAYNPITHKAHSAFRKFDLTGKTLVDHITSMAGEKVQQIAPFDMNQWLVKTKEADSRMITNLSPSTITAGTNSVLTITGSGFGSSMGNINLFNANLLAFSTLNSDYITNWTTNSISLIVPPWAATGQVQVITSNNTLYTSSGDLTVTYAISSYDDPGIQQDEMVRYAFDNADGAVVYQLNASLAANIPAASAVQRAISSWRCSTGTNITLGSNTTIGTPSPDGTNVITFASLPTGVLGIANRFFQWCSPTPVQREAFDTDVRLNGSTNWQYGPGAPTNNNQSDFESVVLHELGHNIGLGHINNLGAVMHPFIFGGTTSRNVDTPAEQAALYMLPFHQSPVNCTGNFPMTAVSPVLVTSASMNGNGSLQQAITNACPGEDILFSSSIAGNTILIGGSPLLIGKNTTIEGLGTNALTLSGNATSRVFDVGPDIEFTLTDIRLLDGSSSTNGGAFYNQGTTTLQNVILEGNSEGSTPKAFTTEPGKTVILEGDVEVKE